MANDITQLTFNKDAYPDVLEVINTLAELEDRKPHDSARRLIVDAGNKRIKELSAPSSDNPQSVKSDNSKNETQCQGKNNG